ncbi:MAG: MBL fold metallo-hydrolase [Acidobacteriia bacterium]|nr:MBL fold metallo-hydrolase [Terriglobia bacterium]
MVNITAAPNGKGVTRREFLAKGGTFGAVVALSGMMPLRAALAADARIAQAPLVDKGFASVRKIGEGLYATISDESKGIQTMCNGGFLAGKDAALLIEGYVTTAGAAFQFDALRMASQVPVKAALNTHYHFDHSLGNAFYGAKDIPLWAHAKVASRMAESYLPIQGITKTAMTGPVEKQAKEAQSETVREHLQSDLGMMNAVYDLVSSTVLSMPNHPLDPAALPLKVDLGGLEAILESFPGHSGTDIIVRVTAQNVVYAGDLIFNTVYPVCFDAQATMSGWRATLKTFASWDKDTLFVPGHGPICGQEGVRNLREVFDDLAEQAEKLHKAGVPRAEAEHRYAVPEKFKSLGIYAWGFTIGPAIAKLYEELESGKH